MNFVPAFLLAYLVGTLLGCFFEGLWGKRFARKGLLPPYVVSTLWPVGLLFAAVAAPFVISFSLGRWLSNPSRSEP